MTPHANTEHYKNHRFPGDIISHDVWLYYQCTLSDRDVQELLFERGVTVSHEAIFNLRGTAAFRRQGDRSGLTRAQRPSEAQSNKLCDPSMGEQNLLSKAASFRGQWLTRQWCRKFGQEYANRLRRRRPQPDDKWHLDDVFLTIHGERHYLSRAVDQDSNILDILVQSRRNKKAAKKFFRKLLKRLTYVPRVIISVLPHTASCFPAPCWSCFGVGDPL